MLTQAELKFFIHYDPNTGEFFRLISSKGCTMGLIVNPEAEIYLRISINNKRYRAHRLAWLYMIGEWPDHHIDHKDTDIQNNKWDNLRKATRSQNLGNRTKQKNNKSGFKGVFWNNQKQKWNAVIQVDGKVYNLGFYVNVLDAAKAYEEAANKKIQRICKSLSYETNNCLSKSKGRYNGW